MNTVLDIFLFLNENSRPVTFEEMKNFWLSLTESEKFYYQYMPLRY